MVQHKHDECLQLIDHSTATSALVGWEWVGTPFPQIFPCVLIFVKVEITPPVHYATS
jgi:hypothetical protein